MSSPLLHKFMEANPSEEYPDKDQIQFWADEEIDHLREQLSDYEEAARSRDALVRQLDVIWNGEAGAAKQASLCDIVCQLEAEVPTMREQVKVLREALGQITDATGDEHEDGDWRFYEIAHAALEQTKPKAGE